VSDELLPGLYEALLTEELGERIERARKQGKIVALEAVADGALAEVLARHLHGAVLESIAC
jgi:hypothetical protein